VLDLGVDRDQLGVDSGGEHPPQHRRGPFHDPVHHGPGLHLHAEIDLLLGHRVPEQLLLLTDHVVVEGQCTGGVGQPAHRVARMRLGPHPDRVRASGDPQV
jgi:hypothetical protein